MAEEKIIADKISLEADKIEYVPTDNLFASGNVVIKYKGYTIESDTFKFLKEQKELEFFNNFKLTKDNFLITADRVYYNIDKKSGTVDNAHAVINNFIINGKNISLLNDNIEITNATLTTCTEKEPHYLVKSGSIQLYPESGGAIAYNNWLYFGQTPVFYFPTFMFASKMFSQGDDRPISPIPDFGFNQLDGWYIRDDIGYFLGPSPGAVNFGYSEKGQFFVGLMQNLALGPHNAFQIKAQVSQRMRFKGGIYYYLDFTQRVSTENKEAMFLDNVVSNFMSNTNPAINKLTLKYAYREFINNYWVDSIPFLEVKANDIGINIGGLNFSNTINLGYLSEYDNDYNKKSSLKFNLNSSINRTFDLNNYFYLTPSIAYFGNFYTIKDWQRFFVNFEIAYNKPDLWIKPSLLGSIKVLNNGESPFKFDSTNVRDDSEIGLRLVSNKEPYEFDFETNYKITKKSLRNLDIKCKILMHCWKLILGYRIVQNEFIISAELN